ncbi:DUF1617 family protein [Sporolactobacillus sp. CQH2019]|uniref:DUF1617 family protein n=1 Tax=Sporolactobacillus sp. CQH2019 TaxID=3023512 RepID=UPI002367674B|nr:DUF1617 family protein [Sporolactobacillus sp. CQH2019]MDD9149265.1 DUF1617 family protein [Sporolactobacillus sp. CQH2019]
MEIKIENQKLVPAINFLFGLSLKGQQSRHRTHFINLLRAKYEVFIEDEQDMRKEECNCDDDGKPITYKYQGQDMLDVKDLDHFKQAKEELYKEERVIDGGDNQVMLQTIKKILNDCDQELSGQDAEVYDYLLNQFEKAEAEAKKGGAAK